MNARTITYLCTYLLQLLKTILKCSNCILTTYHLFWCLCKFLLGNSFLPTYLLQLLKQPSLKVQSCILTTYHLLFVTWNFRLFSFLPTYLLELLKQPSLKSKSCILTTYHLFFFFPLMFFLLQNSLFLSLPCWRSSSPASSAASSSQDLAEVDIGETFAELPQKKQWHRRIPTTTTREAREAKCFWRSASLPEEMKELKGRSNNPGFPPSYGLNRIGRLWRSRRRRQRASEWSSVLATAPTVRVLDFTFTDCHSAHGCRHR